ncbi:MAG TPA: ABC transporter substrate-binding protein [Stellaceae bacterium]|nr:ABC transporter substrate-binding protein [Stellaceae bacterium]
MNRRLSISLLAAGAAACAVAFGAQPSAAADKIKIGVVKSQGGASVFVADAKGYFKEEGLDAQVVTFTSAAPIAVATAAGDVDFSSTALTAAFCNLAYQGTLKIIASGGWERPGFQTIGFLVSNQAYAAGLHSFKDMKGHSAGITQLGTPLEYDLGRILKKYGIAMSDIKIVPLQSNQNVASALKGGEVDTGVQTVANVYPLVERGDAKLLGWVADELGPGQSTVTFTTGKMTKEHPDIVKRFLKAFAKGSAAWDSAFLDKNGKRADQPNAPEMVGIVAKALGEKPDVIARGIGYFDPENRIILSDLQGVLDWYQSNGKIKDHMQADKLVDKRFVIEAKQSAELPSSR